MASRLTAEATKSTMVGVCSTQDCHSNFVAILALVILKSDDKTLRLLADLEPTLLAIAFSVGAGVFNDFWEDTCHRGLA